MRVSVVPRFDLKHRLCFKSVAALGDPTRGPNAP